MRGVVGHLVVCLAFGMTSAVEGEAGRTDLVEKAMTRGWNEDEQRMARGVFRRMDGGADVGSLNALQTRFLNSECAASADCEQPCNTVLLLWEENRANQGNTKLFVDGDLLVEVEPIPEEEVPDVNGITVTHLRSGTRRFRLEAIDGTSSEAEMAVLDAQPFADASALRCRQGDVTGNGRCGILAEWENTSPPSIYDVTADGANLGFISGMQTAVELRDAIPGEHCFELVGIYTSPEGTYIGCAVEACCTVDCETDESCLAPSSVLPCQVAYGPDAENIVRVGWINGEELYGNAILIWLDGELHASLDTSIRNPNEVTIPALSPGTYRLGVQGDCGGLGGKSRVVEVDVKVLAESPHPRPLAGKPECLWSPVDGGTTTVTWKTGDPSDFVEILVDVGDGVFVAVGIGPGNLERAQIRGTIPGDAIVLRFFISPNGDCFASPEIRCEPEVQGPFFVRGLCNGVGGRPNISSAIFLLNFLFLGRSTPGCVEACDGNGDSLVNISDATFILNFLFLGGPLPPGWLQGQPACSPAQPGDDCAVSHPTCV